MTTTKTNEMIQLIYYDLTFNEHFNEYVQATGFNKLGKDYNTVAIIGCQSSGKSTLLNHLFDSNFEVMTEDKGRGQTTQGIWVALNIEYKSIILDCEGTDSKERGEERFKFEHCSSLFALALADVLMINMWTNDVGRYTASNYGVLKIVFEMNLKLFQQECAKKIFIVLRDFDDRYDDKEKITELILKDIYTLWKEIKKPERFKDYPPDRFFEFEFTTLPHKYYYEEKFIEEVTLLRKRLNKTNPNFLFSHVNSEKNVPSDGMSHYSLQLWSDIINDKDLNIPSQKEMLARYRCNEIKDMAVLQVEGDIASLVNEASRELMTDFKPKCEAILKKALGLYESAKEYLPHIFQEVKRQLHFVLSQKIYSGYANQIKKLIPIYQKSMRQDLEKELKNTDNFFECAVLIKKKNLRNLLEQLEKISVFTEWVINIQEYEEIFDEIIDNQRKLSLSDKKNELIKKIRSVMDDVLIQKFEDISKDFWVEFNQEYITHFSALVFSMKDYLDEFYKMNTNEFVDFAAEIETEIYSLIKKDFYKKMKDITNYVVDSYRKQFWYEEGIPRVWNKMDESTIDQLHSKSQKQYHYVFDLFRKFIFIRNPLQMFNYSKATDEQMIQMINQIKNVLEDKTIVYDHFMSESEAASMRRRYDEQIQTIYEDAKRRQANVQQQSIPIWAWIVIVYLGYEDVLRFLHSYWIVPVILLLSVYGVFQVMGLGHVPKAFISMIRGLVTQKLF